MLGGGDQRGVLEMAAEDIFRQISESTTRDFLLRVSFVEIYNEAIRDLLSNDVDASVSIREDPKKVMLVQTISCHTQHLTLLHCRTVFHCLLIT